MDRQLGAVMDASSTGTATRPTRCWPTRPTRARSGQFAKWNLYDAGVRVPLIVRWPGRVKEGGATAAMVSLVDLLPTFVAAAGGEPDEAIDGRAAFCPCCSGGPTATATRCSRPTPATAR